MMWKFAIPRTINLDLRSSSLSVLAAFSLSALAAAVTLVFAAVLAYVAMYDAPYWDLWQHINRDNLLKDLFVRNNEHPVVSNRLLFWLDDRLFGATSRFVQIVSLTALASQVVFFVWLARMAGLSKPILSVGAVSAVFVFYLFGFENTIWIFQVSMVLAFTSAVGAFVCFASHATRESRPALAGAVLFAVLAILSFANGVFVPTLLLAMAAWLKRPRAALAFGLIAVVAWVWQLSAPAGNARAALSPSALDDVAVHFLTQLGAPIGWAAGYLQKIGGPAVNSAAASFPAGIVSIGLAMFALGFVAFRRPGNPAMLALAALIVFSLTTSALVALARFDMGPEQALSSRYNINVAILYSALLIVCIVASNEAPDALRRALAWASPVLAAGLLVMALTAPPILQDLAGRYRGGLAGLVSLVAGVRDESAVGQLFFNYDTAVRESGFFRSNHRWMFTTPTSRRMGHTLAAEERAAPPCAGSFWSMSAPDPTHGFRSADGQLARRSLSSGASHVLLTDGAGVIVGYGRVPRRASDLNPLAQNDGRTLDWIGRVGPNQELPLFAWLADDRSVRCALGAPDARPAVQARERNQSRVL